jgi:hypothetical protein
LIVTDDDGGSTSVIAQQYVAVYDSNAGFVTGSGWINSPSGAYTANPFMTGKVHFALYQNTKRVPPYWKATEFQFMTGNLNFYSSSYDWLVVAGAKVQNKGIGTINGSGDYVFMVTATDGKKSGGCKDKFRIKIWDKTSGDVVY